MDDLDLKIIELLRENSRASMKSISEKVHLTAPAVKNRLNKLVADKVIKQFTIITGDDFLKKTKSFVTLFMKTTSHQQLKRFLRNNDKVLSAYQISGEGGYLINLVYNNQVELLDFLNKLSIYGTYQVSISIEKIK
ncbi:Lrp/AsnC family transcriptional regulator [Pectinatus frisingensis]|uniref:Lrp/AsnC family transcriptional regulator n=1 Tax=Pectinatus frisingensis TaxID=865 RepID=UPI0018C4563D|nr:Lrp/AsnC family transcriptional regulator [Pectinatus frisingensis]